MVLVEKVGESLLDHWSLPNSSHHLTGFHPVVEVMMLETAAATPGALVAVQQVLAEVVDQ